MLEEGEASWRQDDGQPIPPLGDQPLRRCIGERVIVEVDERMRRREFRAPVADERKVVFDQHPNPGIEWFGPRKDDAVGHAVAQDVADRIDARHVGEVRRDDELVGRVTQRRGDAADQRCSEAEELVMGIEHEADTFVRPVLSRCAARSGR